jgi:hypothetical protein
MSLSAILKILSVAQFYKVIAKPALLYGSECWTLGQKDRNRMKSSQMKFIHSLTGVTLRDRIKIEDLRNRWRVHEMVQEVQNYQFKWMQHVLRMPANRLPRKLLKYKPHGRRDLGETTPTVGRSVPVVAERATVPELPMGIRRRVLHRNAVMANLCRRQQ